MDEGEEVFLIPKSWGFVVVLSDVFLVHLSCWQIPGRAEDGRLGSIEVMILLIRTGSENPSCSRGRAVVV